MIITTRLLILVSTKFQWINNLLTPWSHEIYTANLDTSQAVITVHVYITSERWKGTLGDKELQRREYSELWHTCQSMIFLNIICVTRIYMLIKLGQSSLQRWANLFINKLVDQSCRRNRPRLITLVDE